MTSKSKKLIDISLSLALVAAIFLSMTAFADSCEDMYENIIRIRIIANSDSKADQELKIKVRDSILQCSKTMFAETDDYSDALLIANANIDTLRECARQTVEDNGFNYKVSSELRQEYFNTREYDNFTLPAGYYETVVFIIGEGKGENWWCVMYPQVCVGACSGELTDSISENSANYAENAEKYVLKFKTVEIFQTVKKYFKKRLAF